MIDSHAHLSDIKFDDDRESVLKKAFSAGVETIIEISCETKYWDKSLELSKRENIFAVFGIHPNEAANAKDADYKKLENLICEKKCIAVGEFGLDYHFDNSLQNAETQKKSCLRHIDLALKYDKPVSIHCRDAYNDMLILLKNLKTIPNGVIHCFSGTPQQASEFIKLGFMLGIDGPITYKKSDNLKQVAVETDIEKILIETDCPYLAPQKYRGQRNEPVFIVETLSEIAKIKNISFDFADKQTTQNAKNLFSI
jgi:TatD DNase family protein